MKITNVHQLHDSGSFPVANGTDEFSHLIYNYDTQSDERVFVVKQEDGTWHLKQCYSSRNVILPNGFTLVLDEQGEIRYLLPDGSLKEQTRYSFDRFQQLKFYNQRSFG